MNSKVRMSISVPKKKRAKGKYKQLKKKNPLPQKQNFKPSAVDQSFTCAYFQKEKFIT